MKRQQIYVFIGMLAISFIYTNCGQPGDISLKSIPIDENSVSSVPGVPNVPAPSEPTIREIITNCQNAISSGKIQTLVQIVNFEDSRVETGKERICEFAEQGEETAAGNLEMHDETMQSRYEQHRKLNLPEKAVICDIKMLNDLQSFRYDDVFFFSFNGYLLASNNKTAVEAKLPPISRKLDENNFTSLYKYDWLKLRTAYFENVADDYCAGYSEGLSECSWPISEEPGQIKFSFAPSVLISMSAGRPADSQTFSFAITGDDDERKDCYHEKLEFTMKVKYYISK